MTVTVLVFTDGRLACLRRSLPSLQQRLLGHVSRWVLHDDTGDHDHHQQLRHEFPDWELVATPRRSGFAGAYRHGWDWLRDNDRNGYVFTSEDDFVVTRDVDLTAMARVLDAFPRLTQLALRRQPWNAEERAAGGIVESRPGDYVDQDMFLGSWLEHRLFHTTNPSMMRREFITSHRWPLGAASEGRFALRVFGADPTAVAGFWGSRDSGEWVEHIGVERVGHGY